MTEDIWRVIASALARRVIEYEACWTTEGTRHWVRHLKRPHRASIEGDSMTDALLRWYAENERREDPQG